MHLVIDVGNTETVLGLLNPGDLRIQAHWRVSTAVPRTADEYRQLLRSLLAEADTGLGDISRAVIGSVVPSATEVLSATLEDRADEFFIIHPTDPLPIRLDVEEPQTVGADRVVNTLAAKELYGRDTIAVDLGTATTFDCISAEGVFLGGVIAPGIQAGAEWLGRRTAKLPRVEIRPPAQVIGRRTESCIRSGLFYSTVIAIDGIVAKIKEDWERPEAFVVATGGYANSISEHLESIDHTEPFLTLYGLELAGDRLAE